MQCQVMDLGGLEIVDTWREGDLYYEKQVQRPDYNRHASPISQPVSAPQSTSIITCRGGEANLSNAPSP